MTDAITRSARGEDCQVRMPNICNHNPETTVWAHCNGSAAGKGIGMKSPSLLGAYACSSCHDEYDRRTSKLDIITARLYFAEGHYRSLRMLIEKGLA